MAKMMEAYTPQKRALQGQEQEQRQKWGHAVRRMKEHVPQKEITQKHVQKKVSPIMRGYGLRRILH